MSGAVSFFAPCHIRGGFRFPCRNSSLLKWGGRLPILKKEMTSMNAPEPYRVLFVCLGNICRSPAAEIIFKKMVAEQGLEHLIESDSAGMIGYHRGCPPDSRMLTALKKYGYEDPGLKSRPVRKEDLEQFDLIVGMDRENLRDLKRLDKKGQWASKIAPMCIFTTRFPDEEVPDPYYGGQEGFEYVVKLLQDGCGNLLERLKEQLSL